MKTIVNHVPGGPKPAGPYSLGIVAEGKFLFLSGQIPYNPATGKLERGTIEEQTQLVLNNLKSIIEAAGGKIENVVNCRVYLQPFDAQTFPKMNEIYAKFWGSQPPTRTTIGCQLLNCDVEMDCIVVMEK